MVRAVVQRHLDVDDGVAGQKALAQRGRDPFFDRRDVLAGNGAALDGVEELEPLAARQRTDPQPRVAELAAAPGLLLEAALRLGLGGHRLAVGHLGRFQFDLDAVLALQLFHHHFDVELAGTRNENLVGLLVAVHLQGRIFLVEAVERRHDLFFVAARLESQGERDGRVELGQFRQQRRRLFVAQRVAGMRLLQLGDADDLARQRRRGLFLFLALEAEQLPEPLPAFARGVVHGRVAGDGPGRDVQQRQLAARRVHGLEDARGERRVRVGAALHLVRGAGPPACHRGPCGRRRQQVHDGIQHRLDTQRSAAGDAQHRKNPGRGHALRQGRGDFFGRQGFPLQIPHQQVVIGLGHGLDELFPIFVRQGLHVARDVFDRHAALLALEHERPHRQQVHHAAEVGLRADRHLDRRQRRFQRGPQRVQRGSELAFFPIHASQAHDPREVQFACPRPDPFAFDLELAGRAGHEHRGAHRLHGVARVRQEVGIAGRVHDAHGVLFPVQGVERRGQRGLAADFLGLEVEYRTLVVHAPLTGGFAGRIQERLGQRRLADAALTQQSDGPDAVHLVRSHRLLLCVPGFVRAGRLPRSVRANRAPRR